MHKIMVNVGQIREVVKELTDVGFSPQQAKAIIIAVKKIHDGPWAAPVDESEKFGEGNS